MLEDSRNSLIARATQLMQSPTRIVSIAVLMLILITVTACGTASPEIRTIDTFCLLYDPVSTTAGERAVLTEETALMIDKNNAVWLERCDEVHRDAL